MYFGKWILIADDNETVFAWKCHLAFIAPTNSTTWSLSANDKFIEYIKRFDDLAITIPSLINATTLSTAVILWGRIRRHSLPNALDADGQDDWENINLMLIYQGVARSITDIERIEHYSRVSQNFDRCKSVQMTDDKIVQFENQTKIYSNKKWPSVEPCTSKQFIGKNSIFIYSNLNFNLNLELSCFLLISFIEFRYAGIY